MRRFLIISIVPFVVTILVLARLNQRNHAEMKEVYEEAKGRWILLDKATAPIEIITYPPWDLELRYKGTSFFEENSGNDGQEGDFPLITFYRFEEYLFVEADYRPCPSSQTGKLENIFSVFVIDTTKNSIWRVCHESTFSK